MLALLAANGTRLDAGAVGLTLARRWGDSGDRLLFVDADVSGSRLAQRVGVVERADYSPAARGLPSLVTARQPLTLESVAPHCYSMVGGALWTLFGPFHPEGGEYAASWLADRAGELEALDRQRTVVLASSIRPGGTALDPLLQVADVVVVLAPVETGEQAKALWELLRDHGLMSFNRSHRLLLVEGDSAFDDDEIRAETGMHVAGRLPVIDDDRVLRLQNARRDRTLARQFDDIAARLRVLSGLDRDAGPAQLDMVRPPGPAVNSSLRSPSPAATAGAGAELSASAGAGAELSASAGAGAELSASAGAGAELSASAGAGAELSASAGAGAELSASAGAGAELRPSPSPSPAMQARASGSAGIPGPSHDLSLEPRSQGRLWR